MVDAHIPLLFLVLIIPHKTPYKKPPELTILGAFSLSKHVYKATGKPVLPLVSLSELVHFFCQPFRPQA